jgi:hypothetical protein
MKQRGERDQCLVLPLWSRSARVISSSVVVPLRTVRTDRLSSPRLGSADERDPVQRSSSPSHSPILSISRNGNSPDHAVVLLPSTSSYQHPPASESLPAQLTRRRGRVNPSSSALQPIVRFLLSSSMSSCEQMMPTPTLVILCGAPSLSQAYPAIPRASPLQDLSH